MAILTIKRLKSFLLFLFFFMVAFMSIGLSAYAQEMRIKNNVVSNPTNGTQVLLGHVPKDVTLGVVTLVAPLSGNQTLNLTVVLPSKDQSGLDNFVSQVNNPKSSSYHHYLTTAQFNEQYGASSVDSTAVVNNLKSLGLTVLSQSKNGFLLKVTGKVSAIQSAFNVHINTYKRFNGPTVFSLDRNPTISNLLAGKVSAILGMDNERRFHPHYHLQKRFVKSLAVPSVSASLKSHTLTSGISLRKSLKSLLSAPPAPSYLTAIPSGNEVLLYWSASPGATSYNVYRSTTSTGTFTKAQPIDQNDNPVVITSTNFTDGIYYDIANPAGLINGITYYYVVTAVNTAGETAINLTNPPNQASATPYALLGYGGYMGPQDIADAYNLNSVASKGSGQTIGLYELDSYYASDIDNFVSNNSVFFGNSYTPSLTNVPDVNFSGSPGDGTGEVVLDIDMALSVAPSSSIRVYEAPITGTGPIDLWNDIINDPNRPKIISTSWGGDEGSSAYSSTLHNLLAELVATDGVTIIAAAGDAGAYDTCDTGTNPPNCTVGGVPANLTAAIFEEFFPTPPNSGPQEPTYGEDIFTWLQTTKGYINSEGLVTADLNSSTVLSAIASEFQDPAEAGSTYDEADTVLGILDESNVAAFAAPIVDYPASDPYVTGVGISALSTNNPNTANESYANEEASLYGGGGVSTIFSIPSFQTTLASQAAYGSLVSTSMRNVPDVVFTADPATTYYLYVTAPNDQYSGGPGYYNIWGSSAAAPAWAGFLALVNQGRAALGQAPVGWLNPMLYQVYAANQSTCQSTPTACDFHDITSGIDNSYPPYAGNDYYPAKVGYDDVSGLGSFNGVNLYNALIGSAAPINFTATAGSTGITLNWSPVSGASSYHVKRSTTSGTGYTTITTVTNSSYLDNSALTGGTTYYYVVSALNSVGVEGANSAEANAVALALPTAPTTVTAVPGNTQAIVSFSGALANGSTITGYTVTSSPGGLTATGTSSPITVTGLTNGTPYTFTVTTTTTVGTGPASSPSNSVTPNIVPGAPTGVDAIAGNNSAAVYFTAPTPNGGTAITSYTVTSSPGGIIASGSSSPIPVTGLTNGTAYTFTVVANNATGPGAASVASTPVTPAGPPGVPTSVTAVAGNTQATVSFTAPSTNGSAITGYTVTSIPGGVVATGTSSPIIVTGLTDGTSYTFTVTASNTAGTSNASSASNAVIPNIVPAAPTSVSAVAGNGLATVSFTAPTPNGGTAVTSYTVTSSPGGITASGSASPITVTGLTNGATYTFTVVANNITGPGAASSASNSVTPLAPPGIPTSIVAVAGNTQATVSFTAPSANGSPITGYTVTSNPGGVIGTGASSPIIVTGLTDGTSYTFTVTATNAGGTSSASSASNAVIPNIVPAAPTLNSVTVGNGSAMVYFTAPTPNGGTSVISYTVTSSPGGLTATGPSSPVTITGLTDGITYTFTVVANNVTGPGATSGSSSPVTPVGPPGAPTQVTAVAGDSQALVSFTAPSDNGSPITGYTVTSPTGGIISTGTSSPINVVGLNNGTSYTFTVTATNSLGTGVASASSNAVVPAGLPTAPTTVTAVAGNTRATVSFSGASGNGSSITTYTVTSSPAGNPGVGTGSSSPVTVTGLTNGTSYTFTVTATNGVGTSPVSGASNAIIPVIPPVASPTNLKALILAARVAGHTIFGGVSVTWTQSTNGGIVQNNIYRSTGAGGFVLLASVSAGTTYTDKALTKGVNYSYAVSAVTSNSIESGLSNSSTVSY